MFMYLDHRTVEQKNSLSFKNRHRQYMITEDVIDKTRILFAPI